MSRSYWKIFIDEVVLDIGIKLTQEQRNELLDAIEGRADIWKVRLRGRHMFDAGRELTVAEICDELQREMRYFIIDFAKQKFIHGEVSVLTSRTRD